MNESETRIMFMIDNAILFHRERNRIVTGIVISTPLKNHLRNGCCKMLEHRSDPESLEMTKYMGVPIIETSESENRCEVVWKNG